MNCDVVDEAVGVIADMLDAEYISAVSREIDKQAEQCRRTGNHTCVPASHGRRKCFWCRKEVGAA